MTKLGAKIAVRNLGLVCYLSVEWQKFIVNYRRSDPRYTAESSYHTTDADDAVDTARRMAEWAYEVN